MCCENYIILDLCLHLLVSSKGMTTCPTYLRVGEDEIIYRYRQPGICISNVGNKKLQVLLREHFIFLRFSQMLGSPFRNSSVTTEGKFFLIFRLLLPVFSSSTKGNISETTNFFLMLLLKISFQKCGTHISSSCEM